jgi:hypothetical protein
MTLFQRVLGLSGTKNAFWDFGVAKLEVGRFIEVERSVNRRKWRDLGV